MMICQPIRYRVKIALGLMSIVVFVGLYALLSAIQHHANPSDTTIPNFSQLVLGFHKIFSLDWNGDRWIVSDLYATGYRLVVGMSIGITISIIIGLAMGCFEYVAAFLGWWMIAISKVPPTAMMAIYFVLFGTGEAMFAAIIGFGVAPLMVLSIYGAIKKDVPEDLIHHTYTLGASQSEVIYETVFRQILPRILQNIQLQVGPALVFLIAAEWVLSDVGFGYRLRLQSRLLNMNVVEIYLLILLLIGYGIDYGLIRLRRWLCPWFGE
jgi:NitT/TauT family transport system permease protein